MGAIPEIQYRIKPYDTTLRDGGQTPGVNLDLNDKLRLAERLAKVGFPYIEGGWPEANPTDEELFKRAKGLDLRQSELVAFGMTGRIGTKPENDPGLDALLRSDTNIITIFGKSWMLHVQEALRTTGPKNLDTIYNTVAFLKGAGKRVYYDAEHFFDGFSNDKDYALETLQAAVSGGAEVLILCDTNGGATPEFVTEATNSARERFPKTDLGIHVHNDGGLALINTIAAVMAGATQVQGTINGAGERAGNVDFCQFLPTAKFKYGIESGLDLTEIKSLSGFVELVNGLMVPPGTPYTGGNAFKHKGGVHVSAMERNKRAYEHIDPAWVGSETSYEHSDQGGGANILAMAQKHGFLLEKNDPSYNELIRRMKEMGVLGDAQEFLLLHDVLVKTPRPFKLLDGTRVTTTRGSKPDASVQVRINGGKVQEISMGNGPINAFDRALRKVLGEYHPAVYQIKLFRWTQPPTQAIGTEASVIIRAEFGANGDRWTSIASDTDQQTAGENVLADCYNYYILRKQRDPSCGGNFTELPS